MDVLKFNDIRWFRTLFGLHRSRAPSSRVVPRLTCLRTQRRHARECSHSGSASITNARITPDGQAFVHVRSRTIDSFGEDAVGGSFPQQSNHETTRGGYQRYCKCIADRTAVNHRKSTIHSRCNVWMTPDRHNRIYCAASSDHYGYQSPHQEIACVRVD
jgi:hypothetical protein